MPATKSMQDAPMPALPIFWTIDQQGALIELFNDSES
jgi:hypothetical protein